MVHPPRPSAPRWIEFFTSMTVIMLVTGTVALSNTRVRNHVPGFHRAPVATAAPAGIVISLSQLPAVDEPADVPTPTAAPAIAATVAPVVPVAAASFPLQAIPTGIVAARPVATSGLTPTVTALTPVPTTHPAVASPMGTVIVAARVATVPALQAGIPPAQMAAMAPPTPIAAPPSPTALPTPAAPLAPAVTPKPTVPSAPPETSKATVAPAPTALPAPPPAVFLEPMKHWYQGWNQCAEMSASMALSYFGINLDPNNVTAELRPKNGPTGTKNVEFPRIVEFLQGQGVHAQAFQGGTPERVKRLVSLGVPVIVGQWQNRGDHAGIGHWRVVRGYDDAKASFIVNDSMIDPASPVPYAEFDDLWPVYDYVYIPVWNDRLASRVQSVMGEEMDPKVNIARTITYDQKRIEQQPTNAELYFALGGAYFQAGDEAKALDYYHRAKTMGLIQKYPWTLWYQSWPVTALVDTGAYDEAMQTAQDNINSAKTFAIMHYERGRVFELRGDLTGAKREYQMALGDDKNDKDAQDALARIR